MASFYAELQVEGNSYRVVHCSYACHQATDARGRVQAKVRYAPLELVLDVPTDDGLLAWAHAPHKPLAGQVVFYDVARQTAHETIAFTAGECVQYAEEFASSATGDGAYVCQLTITAPSFELRAGGPVAPAAAGLAAVASGVAVVAQQVQQTAATARQVAEAYEAPLMQETSYFSLYDASTHFKRPAAGPLSPDLERLISQAFSIEPGPFLNGVPGFEAAVKADLQAIYNTPTGKQLLDSLHASGKRTPIGYGGRNRAVFPEHPDGTPIWEPAFYDEAGITPGAGLGIGVMYNPFQEKTGDLPWNKRPPGVGLAHELIHAEQAAYGRMKQGDSFNPGGPWAQDPKKLLEVHTFELETVGAPPHDRYALSENKIRSEWDPPQPLRAYY
jgi:hypothetical protein